MRACTISALLVCVLGFGTGNDDCLTPGHGDFYTNNGEVLFVVNHTASGQPASSYIPGNIYSFVMKGTIVSAALQQCDPTAPIDCGAGDSPAFHLPLLRPCRRFVVGPGQCSEAALLQRTSPPQQREVLCRVPAIAPFAAKAAARE
jgi:hypothetical protein